LPPLVPAEASLPLLVAAATELPPSVPVELAFVEPAALAVDERPGGPFGPGGACVVVVDCAVTFGVAVLASTACRSPAPPRTIAIIIGKPSRREWH
jgi:hypothetical protein